MNTKIITIVAATLLAGISLAQADTVWTSGHYEIVNGDIYDEIFIYNDVTVDILGGEIFRLAAYDVTVTDWFSGQMHTLWARDDSIVNLYGGTLGDLWAAENSLVNLYAYDVILDITEYTLTGKYYSDDTSFVIDVHSQEIYSHINVVPEPASILLFSFAGLMLKGWQS